jgi:Arc/MetJ-type ribon-helix-helix transcriptional regulator
MGSKLLLNLPHKDCERIETLVEAGEYASNSEFIRFAIKRRFTAKSEWTSSRR